MSKHMTIINLACTITKLRKWGEAWKHSAESAQNATSRLTAEHERKLAENRASFGARTSADAKIIEGLRAAADEQVLSASKVAYVLRCAGETPVQAAQRVVKERDGLLAQVQDQRAEIERLKLACDTYAADWDTAGKACRIRVDEYPLSSVIRLVRDDAERAAVAKRLVKERDALREEVAAYRAEVAALQERLRASIARGDFAEIEVARLKAQAPKRSHPVKVGEWVECVGDPGCGTKRQVLEVYANWYSVEVGHRWTFDFCRPCDPPEASHATPAGKESAESVIRDSQMTEIKVGDVVEVFQASGKCTYSADIGTRGTVRSMSQPWETMADHRCVDLDPIDGFPEPVCAHVSISDVRKVPQ